MVSVWNIRLALRAPAERDAISLTVAQYKDLGSLPNYTIGNLIKDRFLSDAAVDDFLDIFIDLSRTGDVASFRGEYIDRCHRHVLCGGEVGMKPYPQRLGRAADRAAYLQNLIKANGVTLATADELLTNLEEGVLTPVQRQLLLTLHMSEFGAWVTWDQDSKGAEPPFAFLRERVGYDLRNAMGLPIDDGVINHLPMVILEYRARNVAKLYRPTTADAAEFTRFVVRDPPPPEDSDWFGLTVPWQDDPDGKFVGGDVGYPPKRPEAVHARITFPADAACETLKHGEKRVPQ